MNNIKKITIFFISVLTLSLMLASCINKSSLIKVKVSEVTHSIFYAPQYVAINKGFFKEQGIDIELSTGEGADKVMSAVLSGHIDIGFAGPEAAIYVYNEGKEDYIQVFAQLTKRDGSFIVSRKPENNFKISDLINKTILPGRKGGVPYMTFEYILKQNGINPSSDLILDSSIQFSLMLGAFTSGTGDYVNLFEPNASILEKQNRGYVVSSIGDKTGEIPFTTYFAKKSFINNNNEIIQKFTQAIYEGLKWVNNNSAEDIAKEITSFFPSVELDILTSSIQRYKDVDVWNDTTFINEESFERLQTIMTEANELDKKAPYNEIINNYFSQKIVK